MAPKKRKAGSGNRRAEQPSGQRLHWRLMLVATLVAGAALYLIYLDLLVQKKFSGHRWELPARVYARPMELYVGAPISLAELKQELDRHGYQRGHHAREAGSYAASSQRLELHSRGFEFTDGNEGPVRAMIEFDARGISAIHQSPGGKAADLLRLEPLLIGSFYPRSNEDRLLVPLEQVPKPLIAALIAMEDRQFYQHHGISLRAIARALWADIRAGKAVQGGSTLTQQLVKNFYLTPERSLTRKINEALMALMLEWHYDKDEILEAYLNEVFLGQAGRHAVHGFAQGSQLFFGRPLAELELDQLALLAGMVKAPTSYHPVRQPERALARRNLVLRVMAEQGIIDAEQSRQLQQRPLVAAGDSTVGLSRYPAFLDLVRRQLREDYPEQVIRSEGLRIFSTLDPNVQSIAERVVAQRVTALATTDNGGDQLQGAMVISEVANGEILALVGSRDPRSDGFNRALDSRRSIGSLVKPAVYLTALAQPARYNLNHRLLDQPLILDREPEEPWQPQNFDHRFRGEVPLLDGLLLSLNLPTIRLGLELGLGSVAETIQELGFTRPVPQHPALFLGALGMSPLEVNQIYLTLAAGGFQTPQRAIVAVTDRDGHTMSRYPLTVDQTLDPAAIKLVELALQEVVRRGTGRALQQTIDGQLNIAAKTGTTDEGRDSWLAGFSANLCAVTWVGRDDNGPTGLVGSTGALPIWGEVMRQLPLTANFPSTDSSIGWFAREGGGAAIAAPAATGCRGGYGVPAVAEFPPPGLSACSRSAGDNESSGGSPTDGLKWIFDKIPWPYD